MIYTNARIDQRLERVRMFIEGALGQPGHDHARLQQGRALYEQALAEHQRQRAAYVEQFKARRALLQARLHARTEHARLRKLARAALYDDLAALHRLGLNEPPQQSLGGWLSQARRLYSALQAEPALQDQLVGLGPGRLQSAQAALHAVETALSTYQQTRSASQRATSARDTTLGSLATWQRAFRARARAVR